MSIPGTAALTLICAISPPGSEITFVVPAPTARPGAAQSMVMGLAAALLTTSAATG